MISIKSTGLVYRNPKPFLRAMHTWHPTPVLMDDGSLVVSFDIGQAVESLDYRTYVVRSTDGGATWSSPVPIFTDASPHPTSHSVRLGRLRSGRLHAMGMRSHRSRADEGLVNRANLGYTEMDVIRLESGDQGRSWSGPHIVKTPLVGPAFETCHGILELPDGRVLWPTSTWRGWNGDAPSGMKAVAFVSRDGGQTWPEYLDVMDGHAGGIIYWEQSIAVMPDGRLLAVAWAFDEPKGVTAGVHYAVSQDGRTFGPPRPTDLAGETTKMLSLGDGRVLAVFRGTDPAGLWGAVARLDGDRWVTIERGLLWGGVGGRMFGQGASSDELSNLKFGYPQPVRLPDGDILVVFWCGEDGVNNIRWVRLHIA